MTQPAGHRLDIAAGTAVASNPAEPHRQLVAWP